MARTSQYVKVGKRTLELSNLQKVLFKEEGILKAELIQYYLQIAPTILRHIKGRALSLIRYPDGVPGQSFFQKNKPEWAPPWVESQRLGSKGVDYVLATEEATLVWLANLACVELHPWQTRAPNFDRPDYAVFDLDPPDVDGYDFRQVCTLALDLRRHLEGLGYHPFVKTTGGKGLHVLIPLEAKWDYDDVFEATKAAAKPFVDGRKDATLQLVKNQRKGRILIDIYRNRPSQTIVGPYSIRARKGAPVSTPLTWEEVKGLTDPNIFHVGNVLERAKTTGDPWEAFVAFATPLHTKRKAAPVRKPNPKGDKHKSPEQLAEYAAKRDFSITNEPVPLVQGGDGDAYVVHRHHASRVHYDLRLEEDGVLRSWAVPRGLPPRPGIKRLAVQTEDHPMEYLHFNGVIPDGEYGAGPMWIYSIGRYEVTKIKKTGFYFRLASHNLNAEYRIHKTRDKEWLLERVDAPQVDWLAAPPPVMLASSASDVPEGDNWVYEVKWDGIRALIQFEEGEARIFTRSGRDVSSQFPELLVPESAFRAGSGIFDGEIVCLDEAGRPDFRTLIKRFHSTGEGNIARLSKRYPAYCYVFDVLYLDGRPVTSEPLHLRYDWLKSALREGTAYRLSEQLADGKELFDAAKAVGLEGIMAKDRNAVYTPGKRTKDWLKIKVRQTVDCVIIGFTQGKGDREEWFGALHICELIGDKYVYRGRVGTGYDEAGMKEIYAQLQELISEQKPIEGKVEEEKRSTWIQPRLFCEVQYAMITRAGTFREPVFLRMRPDLS